MRIISQDGMIDINYDNYDIYVVNEVIYAKPLEVLGEYNNTEQALKIMKKIRIAYHEGRKFFEMPQMEDLK